MNNREQAQMKMLRLGSCLHETITSENVRDTRTMAEISNFKCPIPSQETGCVCNQPHLSGYWFLQILSVVCRHRSLFPSWL